MVPYLILMALATMAALGTNAADDQPRVSVNISSPRVNQKPISIDDFWVKWRYDYDGVHEDNIEQLNDIYTVRLVPTSYDACGSLPYQFPDDGRPFPSSRYLAGENYWYRKRNRNRGGRESSSHRQDAWNTRGHNIGADGQISSDSIFSTTVAAIDSTLLVPPSKLTAFKAGETSSVALIFYSDASPATVCSSIGLSMVGPTAVPAGLPAAVPAYPTPLPEIIPERHELRNPEGKSLSRKRGGAGLFVKGGILLLASSAIFVGYRFMKGRSSQENTTIPWDNYPTVGGSIELENRSARTVGVEPPDLIEFTDEWQCPDPARYHYSYPLKGDLQEMRSS